MHIFDRTAKRIATASVEKTLTIGGGYRSSLAHQNGKRGILQNDGSIGSVSSSESTKTLELDSSWSSAGEYNFHKHAPLLPKPLGKALSRQASDGTTKTQPPLDELAEFGQIMARQRKLPGTWYYSSNHILVNKERIKRNIPALTRRIELDALARERAEVMAGQVSIHHAKPEDVMFRIQPCRRFGENVACGRSIREMHMEMIKNEADLNNMIDRRYSYFGMGTAVGKDGALYICQIFKG